MARWGSAFLVIWLILSGCTKATEPEEGMFRPFAEDSIVHDGRGEEVGLQAPDGVQSDIGTDVDQEEPQEISAARGLAEKLMAAVKSGDTDQLIPLLDDTIRHFYGKPIDREMAETILKGFSANFDLDSLAAEIQSWHLDEHASFEFKLLDVLTETRTDPWSDDDRLAIWRAENGSIIFYNPYIVYFPDAGHMVSRYMELIREEDADGLASYLNPDNNVVPARVAEETIDNYREYLKGSSPDIWYLNRFSFVVVNDQGEEHVIEVTYGDGIMGIRDGFIPGF